MGRSWASPRGNLYASLLLADPAERRFLPHLSHVAAVAVVGAIEATLGISPRPQIKWPNDIIFGQAKAAGILVEGTTFTDGQFACVIGCGINCATHPTDLPYEATNLAAQAGRPIEAALLFEALRGTMADAIELWDRGRNYSAIREAWLRSALPVGTPIIVKMPEPMQGVFEGIDDDGRLLMGRAEGTHKIAAGDLILQGGSAGLNG